MRYLLCFLVGAVLVAGLVLPSVSQSQVKVTFIINTATAPDTLFPGSDVRVTGASAGGSGATGAIPRVDTLMTMFKDGLKATNIGGDYWKLTATFQAKDSVRFKFRVNGDWENNSVDPNGFSADNRGVRVGNSDTTLPVMYYNKTGSDQPQYRKPWAASPDSFMNVYFRVNTQGYAQTSVLGPTDTLGVRGGGNRSGSGDFNTPELAWGTTSYMTKESGSLGAYSGANFWSGAVRIRKSTVAPGDTIKYKFIINADWGRSDPNNRVLRVPSVLKDTTVYFSWFQDSRPASRPNNDTMFVTFRANLAKAVQSGGFTIGDTLNIHSGYFGTSVNGGAKAVPLVRLSGTTYQAIDTIVTAKGKKLDYQYYAVKNAIENRENYYNFNFVGDIQNEAEKRQIIVPSAGNAFTVYDTATSIAQDRRQPDFANARKLTRNVIVRWEADLRPAYYQVQRGDTLKDIQGTFDVTKAVIDSIKKWGLWINGPATGGWAGSWGNSLAADTTRKMYDDGTHGDVLANDSIWTRVILASPDSLTKGSKWQIGQTYKFGIRAGDNEGGKGGFGNNHIENISDAASTYIVGAQFGSINPRFYSAWDFDARKPRPPTGVEGLSGLPVVYTLEQNYPNPFNPSTKIVFGLPQQANVELKIYNVLGQEVATLVHENLKAGRHLVTFDATNMASGVYFYKLSAGQFVSTKKMLLMK